ncbi:valine--tRNA ligase, partial [Candidatus Woesearchaeota archaeon]|nr:valine--tRNA ligase [Candidatus Woesearchaeota archaeon]
NESEVKWMKYWEEEGVNAFDKEDESKEVFSIDTPPPTVSGKMHMGHASMYSQMDFIARYKRMKGFNLFYPFGTDDNGLPTKLLIEKTKKVKASMMDRSEFVKLCLDTLNNELRPAYILDWKKIGISADFNLFYSTIDDHSRKVSQKSFLDLYKLGREYRAEAAAMFCPKCRTAISQVECEDIEQDSFFNDIVFKVKNDEGKEEDLIIATTRPELLPACVSIFYHPEDDRYKHLKGKMAKVPLFDIEVPIMEDEGADPEKGTGIVMCCTFGDSKDVEWQKIHNLPIREAITKNGKMSSLAEKYEDMKPVEARKVIIEDMKEQGLLLNQKPIKHPVNTHERCGTPIEFIHSKQWFIKYLDLKDEMLKWGEELKWKPEFMKTRYSNWVNGLQWDWCISRQLPFGVPFPVWYCEDCDEVILAKEEDLPVDPITDKCPLDKCPSCESEKIIPETDIINTWATSSLTPEITAQLCPERYNDIYPMSLRPQAHDIITFWLFNTVVKSQLHNNKNPWKDCTISGFVLDPKGKKMSKSKGNVIEPQIMIEKYSSDALRYWAAGTKLGDDMPFQEKELITGKKTVTKIWNASKFSLMHLEDYDMSAQHESLRIIDRWVLSKLNKLIKSSTEAFENYQFHRVRLDVDNFFWNTFCDLYLELVKDRLYNPDIWGTEQRTAGQHTLYHLVLDQLKMFAPFVPFITEEVYHLYFNEKEGCKSIHNSSWPEYDEDLINEDAERIGDVLIHIVEQVRKAKTEEQLSIKAPIKVLKIKSQLSADEFELIQKEVEKTLNVSDIEYDEHEDFALDIEFAPKEE